MIGYRRRHYCTCNFDLTELLFDYDFPGHYNRRIKTIALSIPAVVGPYQSVQATLIQQSNKVVMAADLDVVEFLLDGGELNSSMNLRSNWRPSQQIAVSREVNDSGMFELNFRDERYLPFEGTGAISSWELRMPKRTNRFDFNTISDVIIHLRYTASSGGDAFMDEVMGLKALENYSGYRFISLSQEFSTDWYNLTNSEDSPASMTISLATTMFPYNFTEISIGDSSVYLLTPDGLKDLDQVSEIGVEVSITPTEILSDLTLTLTTTGNDPITEIVSDILLVLPYTGTW